MQAERLPMTYLINRPVLMFALSLLVFYVAARIGALIGSKRPAMDEKTTRDFGIILTATLTMLGLVIGFTFSMAMTRYDQRKNYEENEANAIGTEYARVEVLPEDAAARAKALLSEYLSLRISFYSTRNEEDVANINARTSEIQNQLWSTVRGSAVAEKTPVTMLVLTGMNDVLNSKGYTQASWWNRIPLSAWGFLTIIGILANLLIGFGSNHTRPRSSLLFILPLLLAFALFFIADIDSPRGGIIRVRAPNLENVSQTMASPGRS
jgi:flagellar basal body-associated protein FliL